MKRKALLLCFLVFVKVWNFIVSVAIDFKKYEYDSNLAEYRCTLNETTFEANDIFDHVTCGKLCYLSKICLSFFYLQESNTCIGCRHKYTGISRSHEKLLGSHYFRPLSKMTRTVTRECFDVGYAQYYSGKTHTKTRGGISCQRWDSQEPHKHSQDIYEALFPEKSFKEAENYCRAPDGQPSPWCYTTDPNVEWDFCDVPQCSSTDCYRSDHPSSYQGYEHVTRDNLECQRWDHQSPHTHTFTDPKEYPDVSLSAANNYCRDPDGRGEPWCFTTGSKVWDYCHVELCPLDYCYRNVSWEYQGQYSYVESGAECQRWDSNYPQEHQYGNMPSKFPDNSVSAAGHYCRDPSKTGRPWCYTTDPEQEWGWCTIREC